MVWKHKKTPLINSLIVGAVSALIVAFLLAILISKISFLVKIISIFLAMIFVVTASWHYKYKNWEFYAKRKLVFTLHVFGAMLIGKSIISLVIMNSDIKAEIDILSNESNELSAKILYSVFSSTPLYLEVVFLIIGVIMLLSALYVIRDHEKKVSGFFQLKEGKKQYGGVSDIRMALSTYDSDLPPLVDVWVGRESEMELLESTGSGVVAITGIGGQGKSALAATALMRYKKNFSNCFWDWRDCREQGNSFKTQLLSVIEHFTEGDYPASSLGELNTAGLSSFLFKAAGSARGFIVFDNVDHYVESDQSLFISDLSSFVDECLRVEHNFTILITCRPRISYPSGRFREIYLRGLSVDEVRGLFNKKIRHKNIELEYFVEEFRDLTKGHPLWLNIIASQIDRKPESASKFLNQLREGCMDDQSKAMLRGVWSSLNDNQKLVLRCMAEIPRATESLRVYEYLRDNIKNYNKFDKAFQSLRSISLIIEKTSEGVSASRFELHPMVKSFIRSEYRHKEERNDLLDALILQCGYVVVALRENSSIEFTVEILEQLITKAEFQLSLGNYAKCIETLNEATEGLVDKGLYEELIRLCLSVLENTEFKNSSWVNDDGFERLFSKFIKLLSEDGSFDELFNYLDGYRESVSQGTARYIGVCELYSYTYWMKEDYLEAISWGERGLDIKKKSGLDTSNDTEHNLALARRDSGEVETALQYFLRGEELDQVLIDDHFKSERGADFYGNIGRCLALQKNLDSAKILYCKSFDLLEKEDGSHSQLNLGYASLWLAEINEIIGDIEIAICFYLNSIYLWDKRAKKLADKSTEKLSGYIGNEEYVNVLQYSDDETADKCSNWVSSSLS